MPALGRVGQGQGVLHSASVKNFFRPSEGEAEGGCGGNFASPEPKRSPAALLVQSRPPKKSFVFLLEEKIGGAQIKNCKQNFSLSERTLASGGGAERQNSAFGFSLKKVRISFSVRSQIVCCEFVASALRASAGRLYSICQDFLGSTATFCESKTRFEPILFIPSASGRTESKAIIFNSPKAI